MISVEDHLARILAAVARLAPRELELLEARGCVLAEEVTSPVPLPGFTNSAMDGYAVRSGDVAAASEASPVVLRVAGDIAAGNTEHLTLPDDGCLRIMTGAPMPEGADAVVPVEQTDGGVDRVEIREAAGAGQHVRPAGDDLQVGDTVLPAGTVLGPRQLAVLAAVGRGRVEAVPRPRVAVISTGDELVEPGTVPGFGQVVDSNSLMVAAALGELGADAHQARVRDDTGSFAATLAREAAECDAIITTGGVSMGAYDTVKEVLAAGGEVTFDRVAMQPGKPQGFGLLGPRRCPVFTLPGNPVSTLVSFVVFGAPARRQRAGRSSVVPTVAAVADHDWTAPEGKVQFARVSLRRSGTGWSAALAGGQGSYVLGGLAAADALAVIPAEVTRVHAGDRVQCRVLGDLEER
jgi:molybdopterin molybdotransferase